MTPPPEPPAPVLIPTHCRHPIARDLSYPIGAERLSAELAGVPQFAALNVWFWGVPSPWCDARRVRLPPSEPDPRPVLAAWFTNNRVGLTGSADQIANGYYGEKWGLTVYAVPSRLKATVRAALEAEGLAIVRGWLAAPRTETWRGALRHEIEVLYDFDARVMSWRESVGWKR